MRLALVTNGLGYGGAERIVETLATQFRSRGADVAVVAVTRDGPIGDALAKRGIHVEVLGIQRALDASIPLRLARFLRGFRADVAHSHLEVSDIAVALASPFVPKLGTVSTLHNLGRGALGSSRLKRALWRACILRFDRVVAVGRVVAEHAPAGVDASVVYGSVLLASDAAPSRSDARRDLGVGEDVPLVMGVGRLSREKGFDVLSHAVSRLGTRGARAIVIGDGPERHSLEAMGSLELLGARRDAARLIAAADVFVCPSRTEGFSQTLLEAMSARVPIVATRVGGNGESVADGSTGVIVPPDDPGAIAHALDVFFQMGPERRTWGERGRRRLVECGFTAEAMCASMETIYATLRSRR